MNIIRSRLYFTQCRSVSKVRCKVCGGWGGEWGLAQGVGPMCVDCWRKGGHL